MEENNNQQIQINVDKEIAQGIYSNLALIAHGPTEFVLDFASMLPAMPKANVGARVIMAPEHAKRLLLALQDNVMKYEQHFGQIDLNHGQKPQGGTIAPFGNGQA